MDSRRKSGEVTGRTRAITAAAHVDKIVTAAGLEGALTEAGATAIVAKMAASGTADPAKYVPKAAFDDLAEQVATLTTARAKDKAGEAIAAAQAAGKLTPAMRGWAEEYAAKDLAGFETWAKGAPVIASARRVVPAAAASGKPDELSAEDRAVIAATGVSEEAFLATKAGKPPAKKEA